MPNLLDRTTPRVAASELVAAGGVVAIGAAFLLSPDHIEDGPVLCPFRRLTGLPCPGCGLTRSWVYAAHGWWRESLSSHPFGLFLVVAVGALATMVLAARWRRRPAPDLNALARRPLVLGVGAAWLTFAVVRLAMCL
ncbi:MAG: DUF2752 domain-containing protein [Propionibacteriales bacterium]|nr:DUF2752 domain-containing protein [Propionibacteriales bacterium]